jgi:hypothetical protein
MDLNSILYDTGKAFLKGHHPIYAHIDHIAIDRILKEQAKSKTPFGTLKVVFKPNQGCILLEPGGDFTKRQAIDNNTIIYGTGSTNIPCLSILVGKTNRKNKITKYFNKHWATFYNSIKKLEKFIRFKTMVENLVAAELLNKNHSINLSKIKSSVFNSEKNIIDQIVKSNHALIIPVIDDGKKEDYITQSPLYRDYCDYITNGDPPTEGPFYTCPICHQQVQLCSKNNSYAPERYMITKLFTVTKTNMAYGFDKKNYSKSFQPCRDCRPFLYAGAKKLFLNKITMAGYPTLIAPEVVIPNGSIGEHNVDVSGIVKNYFGYNLSAIEFKNYEELFRDIAAEMEQYSKTYAINLISYETDGKWLRAYNVLEDVPILTFIEIAKAIEKAVSPFQFSFHLGSIYRMVPLIKTKKTIDSRPVFAIYNSLFRKEKIDTYQLLRYYSQALFANTSQIEREKKDKEAKYSNLGPERYLNMNEPSHKKVRYFIKSITIRYLILFRVLQEMGLLTTNLLFPNEEENRLIKELKQKLNSIPEDQEEARKAIKLRIATEQFLDEVGYVNKEAKAMFYLGRLVSETEREQRDNAGDRKDTVKTIASGIPFHNLDFYGITRLHVAAVEKLEQLGCLYLKKWVVDAFLKNFGWQTAESWNMGKDQAIFCFMLGYSAYIDIDIVDNDINDIDDVDDIDDIDDIDDVDGNIDNTDN